MKQLKLTNTITNRESESVDRYLLEISKNQLLDTEMEGVLAKRIREGDTDALDLLVKSNLRFVVSVAKQYQNQGLPLSDLINEGNLGLIRAAQKFDETRGFKFISYAVWWIRQAMNQAVIEQSKIIRIPVNKAQSYAKINRAFQMLESEYQRDPGVEDVAEKSGVTEDEVTDYLNNIVRTVSTEIRQGFEGTDTIGDLLTDLSDFSPEDIVMKKSVDAQLGGLLAELNERDRTVISCYFGLEGKDPMTLEEIGQTLDLTRERVRQIKEKCLEKLKNNCHVSLLESYPNR
jgi:RNA polymerase primary sigma factor